MSDGSPFESGRSLGHSGLTSIRSGLSRGRSIGRLKGWISGVDSVQAPTRGRMLDRIGFEVENLEAFCKELEAKGIKFDRPYGTLASGVGLAFLPAPWGTSIELTEGLRRL